MSSIEILGTGYVSAEKKISNFDLEKRVDTSGANGNLSNK